MSQLSFHDDVHNEVRNAYNWYNAQSAGLGEEYLKELDKAFGLIEKMPMTWPEFSGGFKRHLLKRFPFGIIYKSEKTKYI